MRVHQPGGSGSSGCTAAPTRAQPHPLPTRSQDVRRDRCSRPRRRRQACRRRRGSSCPGCGGRGGEAVVGALQHQHLLHPRARLPLHQGALPRARCHHPRRHTHGGSVRAPACSAQGVWGFECCVAHARSVSSPSPGWYPPPPCPAHVPAGYCAPSPWRREQHQCFVSSGTLPRSQTPLRSVSPLPALLLLPSLPLLPRRSPSCPQFRCPNSTAHTHVHTPLSGSSAASGACRVAARPRSRRRIMLLPAVGAGRLIACSHCTTQPPPTRWPAR